MVNPVYSTRQCFMHWKLWKYLIAFYMWCSSYSPRLARAKDAIVTLWTHSPLWRIWTFSAVSGWRNSLLSRVGGWELYLCLTFVSFLSRRHAVLVLLSHCQHSISMTLIVIFWSVWCWNVCGHQTHSLAPDPVSVSLSRNFVDVILFSHFSPRFHVHFPPFSHIFISNAVDMTLHSFPPSCFHEHLLSSIP